MFMLKALNPEKYDERVRLKKYELDRGATPLEELGSIRVVLERGEEPARLRKTGG